VAGRNRPDRDRNVAYPTSLVKAFAVFGSPPTTSWVMNFGAGGTPTPSHVFRLTEDELVRTCATTATNLQVPKYLALTR